MLECFGVRVTARESAFSNFNFLKSFNLREEVSRKESYNNQDERERGKWRSRSLRHLIAVDIITIIAVNMIAAAT